MNTSITNGDVGLPTAARRRAFNFGVDSNLEVGQALADSARQAILYRCKSKHSVKHLESTGENRLSSATLG